MKTALLIFALFVTGSPSLLAGSNSVSPVDPVNVESGIKRDSLVDVSYRMIDSAVYFKLLMMNDSKDGYYSMIRVFDDGRFESVDIRQMIANEINQPILYCFVDKALPLVDFTYILLRIADNTEEIKRWSYCAETGNICDEPTLDLLAIHK